MSLIKELRRRNVLKVATLYGVAAWVILQVADVVLPALGAPDWGMRLIIGLLILGLPVALLLAWKFELTPDGLRTEAESGPAADVSAETGRRIYLLIGLLAALAVAIMIAGRSLGPETPEEQQAAATDSAKVAGAMFVNTAPAQSVAVLPFMNMSDDPESIYLSDGIAEEILNSLAAVPGLYVAARTSSFYFRDYVGDLAPVARQLRVRHLLEGSVRRAADRIRITAQLVNATNGYHLWSETYDRSLDDIFDIEDDIARNVTEQLRLALNAVASTEPANTTEPPTAHTAAYLAYLKGRKHLASGGIAGQGAARESFEEAIALDPGFAGAYANLAIAYTASIYYGNTNRWELAPAIRAAADRALELDDGLAHAWLADALAKAVAEGDSLTSDEAFESIDRAYEMAPHDSDVLFWRTFLLNVGHDSHLAHEAVRQALIRDPLSAPMHETLCAMYGQGHEFKSAIDYCLRAAELAPDNPSALWLAAWFASWAGRFDDAVRFEAQALERDPADVFLPVSMANHYVELGDLDRAGEWLVVAQRVAPNAPYTHHARVWSLWWAGKQDQAGREAQDFFGMNFHRDKANEDMTDYVREVLVEYRLRRREPEMAITTILDGEPPVTEIDESTDPELIMKHLLLLPAWRETDPETAERVAAQIRDRIEPEWRGPLHRWDHAVARCGVAGFQGRLDDALANCEQQYRIGARWSYHWWQISSLFDPVRDETEWQAFIAEIKAERVDQLARLRASGDEPIPGRPIAEVAANE